MRMKVLVIFHLHVHRVTELSDSVRWKNSCILQMIKLRPREASSLAQSHTADDDDNDDTLIFSSKQMSYAQGQLGLIPSVPG